MSLTSMKMSMNSFRVTSYNVLSTNLGGADFYQACDPRWLDPQHRLNKLKEKLNSEINQKSIICLQEVSHTCANTLHPYFAKEGYYFVTGQYGTKFNGYMGVGVAVPMDKYNIEGVDITRVADTKKSIKKLKDNTNIIINFLKSVIMNPITTLLKKLGLMKEKKASPFEDASKRMNQMVSVRLSPKNSATTTSTTPSTTTTQTTSKVDTDTTSSSGNTDLNTTQNNSFKESSSSTTTSFVVGTYHMPCMFYNPAVMMIHCALSAQHIQKYAKGSPYIFTGDFNIKPVDSMYKLLTEGDVDTKDPIRPINEPGDDWSLKVQPMNSAYKLYNQKEPEFTNYAQVKSDPPFIDTLDYIFLSSHWKVNHVLQLPTLESMTSSSLSSSEGGGGGGGPLPTEHEPSDHLMIAADVSLSTL